MRIDILSLLPPWGCNRPIYCVNCGAVFSRLSSVSDQVGD